MKTYAVVQSSYISWKRYFDLISLSDEFGPTAQCVDCKNEETGDESGAIIINKEEWAVRAEILPEKGTNLRQFFRGVVDEYFWVGVSSSFLPSALQVAYFLHQFRFSAEISEWRMKTWNVYNERLASFKTQELLKRLQVSANCTHNAHLYFVLVNEPTIKAELRAYQRQHMADGILHSCSGKKFARICGDVPNTDLLNETLLPFRRCSDLTEVQIEFAVPQIGNALAFYKQQNSTSVNSKIERSS